MAAFHPLQTSAAAPAGASRTRALPTEALRFKVFLTFSVALTISRKI